MASDIGEDAFVERARRAFERGLRLVQLREKEWPQARVRSLADRLLALAAPFGAQLLLNGDAAHARTWGLAGVHWTAATLAQAAERPADLICAASCHTRDEIAKAGALELDFVVLGPVAATPTHPGATLLGWDGFASHAEGASVPVFALGGLSLGDLDRAIDRGAHGVALRRGAWTD